jgi:hypothetical protein
VGRHLGRGRKRRKRRGRKLGDTSTAAVRGMPTRNGRILFSFGNWIAVFADHSCRQGVRCRMPDFYPHSISEFQPLNTSWRTSHFIARSGRAGHQPWPRGWEPPGRVGNFSRGVQESARKCNERRASQAYENPTGSCGCAGCECRRVGAHQRSATANGFPLGEKRVPEAVQACRRRTTQSNGRTMDRTHFRGARGDTGLQGRRVLSAPQDQSGRRPSD